MSAHSSRTSYSNEFDSASSSSASSALPHASRDANTTKHDITPVPTDTSGAARSSLSLTGKNNALPVAKESLDHAGNDNIHGSHSNHPMRPHNEDNHVHTTTSREDERPAADAAGKRRTADTTYHLSRSTHPPSSWATPSSTQAKHSAKADAEEGNNALSTAAAALSNEWKAATRSAHSPVAWPPNASLPSQEGKTVPSPTPIPTTTTETSAADIRQTIEYRAAWDLELWKAIQADQFRQQLARHRQRALADLARVVSARAESAEQTWRQRESEWGSREEAMAQAERALHSRQRRLASRERNVRRVRQRLVEAEQRAEEELRAQVRRAEEDIQHRVSLMQERLKAAEAQTQRAEERQRQAQTEYLSLYEEFARFRTRQVTQAADNTNNNNNNNNNQPLLASGRTSSPRNDVDEDGVPMWRTLDRVRAQHASELRLMEQRHSAELVTLNQRCRSLTEQNMQLTAALSRRREQLRAMRRQRRLHNDAYRDEDEEVGSRRRGGEADAEDGLSNERLSLHEAGWVMDEEARMGHDTTIERHEHKQGEHEEQEYEDEDDVQIGSRWHTRRGGHEASASPSSSSLYRRHPRRREGALAAAPSSKVELAAEMDRLQRERVMLIACSGGALDTQDDVVRRIDARLRELRATLQVLSQKGHHAGDA